MGSFRHRHRSFVLKPAEARRTWHLVDAKGQAPGRLATRVAGLLRGKDNPRFTPHTDSGDFVVVINAGGLAFTGKKLDRKIYHRHSGHVGGLKRRTAREQMERDPRKVVLHAVKGMLPKNALGRRQLRKLKVFAGADHPHKAQGVPVP